MDNTTKKKMPIALLSPDHRWKSARCMLDSEHQERWDRRYDDLEWLIVDHHQTLKPPKRRDKLIGNLDVDLSGLIAIRENRPMRLRLESRILGYRDGQLAAQMCGYSTKVVEDYCAVFFDVIEHLDMKRWIIDVVVNQSRDDWNPDPLRTELYRSAYFGGQWVTEHWLEHLPFLDQGIEHDLTTEVGRTRAQLDLHVDRARLAGTASFHAVNQLCEYAISKPALPQSISEILRGDVMLETLGKAFEHFMSSRPQISGNGQRVLKPQDAA